MTHHPLEHHDEQEARCRMLGHEVPFSYCRKLQGDYPCRNVANCWFERFDVMDFLKMHFTEEEIQKFLTPAKPRMQTLIEMIEQARQRTSEQTD